MTLEALCPTSGSNVMSIVNNTDGPGQMVNGQESAETEINRKITTHLRTIALDKRAEFQSDNRQRDLNATRPRSQSLVTVSHRIDEERNVSTAHFTFAYL